MKVQCGQCPAKYAVSDDRIAGKKVRLRCKRCEASIVVNGKVNPATVTTTPAVEPVEEEAPSESKAVSPESEPRPVLPPSRPPAPTMMGGLEAPLDELLDKKGDLGSGGFPSLLTPVGPAAGSEPDRSQAPASTRGFTESPPDRSETKYRVALTPKDLRWMTRAELVEAHASGVVDGGTFVFVSTSKSWEKLASVPGLEVLAQTSSPPPRKPATIPPPSSRPPPRRARPDRSLVEAAESLLDNTNGEADAPVGEPEETVPFSLDVSRASNRPSAEKDLSFLELAEKTANESPPDPAPETLERHLTSPPEAGNTSPSLAPPSLAVKRSAADLWLAILVLVGLCAVAVWYFQVEFGLQEYLSFVPGPPRK